MPPLSTHLARWLRRHWLLTGIIATSLALGLMQLWLHLRYTPSPLTAAVLSAISLLILLIISWLLLQAPTLRRPLANLRYRWQTREIDRRMKRPKGPL